MRNYSPYNKTYRYLLYQNQAYHIKNRRTASPEIKTNLRHSMSRHSPIKNPENNFEYFLYRSTRSQSTNRTNKSTNIYLSDNQLRNIIIDDPIRHIHKHQTFNRLNQAKIQQSNQDLVNRMIEVNCTVVKKSNALNSYDRHKNYSQIRAKFNQRGKRKESFSLGRKSLLCPTLQAYMKSGLGKSFLCNLTADKQRKSSNKMISISKINKN